MCPPTMPTWGEQALPVGGSRQKHRQTQAGVFKAIALSGLDMTYFIDPEPAFQIRVFQ